MMRVSIAIAIFTSSFEYQAWETFTKHPNIDTENDPHVGYIGKYSTSLGNICKLCQYS